MNAAAPMRTRDAPAACPFCERQVAPKPLIRYEQLTWLECPRCAGGWLEPYVGELDRDDEDFAVLYRHYIDAKPIFDAVAEEKARWLAGRWEPGMAVVEVGAGVGSVAQAVRRLRPDAPVLLVEPRASFAAFLRESGFEVFGGEPEQATGEALSAVQSRGLRLLMLLDNVLEHVPFPARLVANVHARSAAGSLLLVEVPNEHGLAWRARVQDLLRGERKPPTFPGHINLFTRDSLAGLCRRVTGNEPAMSFNPIRRAAQVAYLSQDPRINWRVRAAIGLLNVLPIDLALGVGYWLRAEIPVGTGGGGTAVGAAL